MAYERLNLFNRDHALSHRPQVGYHPDVYQSVSEFILILMHVPQALHLKSKVDSYSVQIALIPFGFNKHSYWCDVVVFF